MSELKERLKNFFAPIHRLVASPGFNIFIGIVVVAFSVYDIFEDVTEMRKEYLTLIIGIMMIINELNNFWEGAKKILATESNAEAVTIAMRIKKIMKSPAYYIFIGIIIIVTSIYDISENFFKILKEHFSLVIGIILIIIAIKEMYDSGKNMIVGVKEELKNHKL